MTSSAQSLHPLTLYAYRGWSIWPLGSAEVDAARDACWDAMLADDTLDCVRAIDDRTGDCRISIDRDEAAGIVDRSDMTV